MMADDASGPGNLRILQIHRSPDIIGGSERSLELSVEALRVAGHGSILLCEAAGTSAPLFDEAVERPDLFVDDPHAPWVIARLEREFQRVVESVNPDVVHIRLGLRPELVRVATSLRPTIYTAHVPICPNGARHWYRERTVCVKRVGAGCVLDGYRRHGCGHLASGEPVSLPAFARSLWTTKRSLRGLDRCRYVIVSSQWQADRLIADGVRADRVEVIHPPLRHLDGSSIAEDVPVVAVGARLVAFKGVDHLLRASARMETEHRVWIIGDGPERSALERLARALGIDRRVTFYGPMSPPEADALLARAHVVAVPSLFPETFGQVGAQAAAAGKRVVAYDSGGIRDWAERHPNATLIETGNIDLLVRELDHALASDPVEPAVPQAFSIEQHATSLIELYRAAAEAADE